LGAAKRDWFHRARSPVEAAGRSRVAVAGDGLIGVNGRVWDADGNLVASGGAQLYSIPR
jgi:hypothetical protein